jgi:hypothetical protein
LNQQVEEWAQEEEAKSNLHCLRQAFGILFRHRKKEK